MELQLNNNVGCNNSHLKPQRRYPVALSIAGSDSSGGAGIQADIKTFSALGVYGATAITAVTAQNTVGVGAQFALPPKIVYDQIVAVIEDIYPSVIKIGMLSNAAIANAVADALTSYDIPIILDPVMVSSSGHRLLSMEAQEVVKSRLLPISTLITPNIPEVEALANISVVSDEDKLRAASHLITHGARAVLIKGGHEKGDTKSDALYQALPEGIATTYYSSPTISSRNIHGTGCTLSSAIAAHIAMGLTLEESIRSAKEYIYEAIKAGADVSIGHGFGPVNHLFNPQKMRVYEE